MKPALASEPLSRPYSLYLSPQFGFIHGQAEEIVYPYPLNKYKAELLSQLFWNMKPVLYYGLSLDFSRTRPLERWGGFVNLSLKNGIPGISGKHENRDWMSIENDSLTHYSVHDNETKELFLGDVSAGFSFPLHRALLLKTGINVSYMRFSFSGWDGEGTYARGNPPFSGKYHPITDNPEKRSFKGKVINYTQNWLTIAPGIALDYYFLDYFVTALSFQISPVVICAALDEHLTPETYKQFRDYVQGGLLLEPGFRFGFIANSWIAVSVDFSWRYITGSRGLSYYRTYGKGTYTQQGESGAGLSIMDTGLSFKIRL